MLELNDFKNEIQHNGILTHSEQYLNHNNSQHHVHFRSEANSTIPPLSQVSSSQQPLSLPPSPTPMQRSSPTIQQQNKKTIRAQVETQQPSSINDTQRHSIFISRETINSTLALKQHTKSQSSLGTHSTCCCCCVCCLPASLPANSDNLSDNYLSSVMDGTIYEETAELTFKQNLNLWCKRIGKFLIGIILCIFVCSSWLLMSFLMRKVVNDLNSNRTLFTAHLVEPSVWSCNFCYFLVWLTTCFLILIYPIYFLFYVFIYRHIDSNSKDKYLTKLQLFKSSLQVFDNRNLSTFTLFSSNNSNNSNTTSNNSVDFKISFDLLKDFFLKIGGLTLIWILTGYAYLKAIDLLDFSDVIMIFAANYALTYMASWIVLHNKFIPIKLVAIILSIFAIVFLVYSGDGFKFDTRFLGNTCGGLAAAGTAIIKLIIKYLMQQKSSKQKTMLFTAIGFFNMLFCWPIILLLHFTNVEFINLAYLTRNFDYDIEFIWLYIIGAVLLALAYVLLLQYGSSATHEIFIELGCFLTIPISKIVDVYFLGVAFDGLKIYAFISMVIGYAFLILPDNIYTYIKTYLCPHNVDEKETGSLTRKYRTTIHGNS